jgi:isochorismate hydrolase
LNIDVQNYCTGAKAGKSEYFQRSLQDVVLPNIRRLQSFCRTAGIEAVYSVIDNMTR